MRKSWKTLPLDSWFSDGELDGLPGPDAQEVFQEWSLTSVMCHDLACRLVVYAPILAAGGGVCADEQVVLEDAVG